MSNPRAIVTVFIAVAVAAIGGSLVTGTSVFKSVEGTVLARLGRADVSVDAPGFLHEGIADELKSDADAAGVLADVVPLVALDGVISNDSGHRRVPRVAVYGVDDRFWQFHQAPGVTGPASDEVLLSPVLATALAAGPGALINIRVDDGSETPADSLHGRKDGTGRTLSLRAGATPSGALNLFGLQEGPEGPPAVFVPLALLQQDGRRAGRVNTLLIALKPGQPPSRDVIGSLVQRHMTLDDIGLTIGADEALKTLTVQSPTGLIDDARADRVTRATFDIGGLPTSVMTILANAMRKGDRELPYPFVTSIELQTVAPDVHAEELSRPPIVLNNIIAARLNASVGDSIAVEYPTWAEPGRVENHVGEFEVAGILPVSGAADDATYAPDVPGVTGAATIRDWMPRFQFDPRRITTADEQYWARYGPTPAAFVAPQVGRALWRSRAGALTSIRVTPPDGSSLAATREQLESRLHQSLTADAVGASVLSVNDLHTRARTAAVATTALGTRVVLDSLPLALSALMLAAAFFAAFRLPSRAAVPLAATGLAAGAVGAIAVAALLLEGLRTTWTAAVPPADLSLHLSWAAASACVMVSLAAFAACRWMSPFLGRRAVIAALISLALVAAALLGIERLGGTSPPAGDAHDGTGGFGLFVALTRPMIWSPATPEGIDQLGLTGVPGVRVSPLRLHDDPHVVSVEPALVSEGRFTFVTSLERSDEERANPWLLLDREQHDRDDPSAEPGPPILPVVAGATAMTTRFGGRLGTDLVIEGATGAVRLRAVAVLATSVLDDALVMSEAHFLQLFPAEQGYRALLVEAPADRLEAVRSTLDDHLAMLGADVQPARERVRMFNGVQRAHASLFSTLLGAGLLLAIVGLTAYTRSTT